MSWLKNHQWFKNSKGCRSSENNQWFKDLASSKIDEQPKILTTHKDHKTSVVTKSSFQKSSSPWERTMIQEPSFRNSQTHNQGTNPQSKNKPTIQEPMKQVLETLKPTTEKLSKINELNRAAEDLKNNGSVVNSQGTTIKVQAWQFYGKNHFS